jgi:hypothetical protein
MSRPLNILDIIIIVVLIIVAAIVIYLFRPLIVVLVIIGVHYLYINGVNTEKSQNDVESEQK